MQLVSSGYSVFSYVNLMRLVTLGAITISTRFVIIWKSTWKLIIQDASFILFGEF